jgi:hypothetical protein
MKISCMCTLVPLRMALLRRFFYPARTYFIRCVANFQVTTGWSDKELSFIYVGTAQHNGMYAT